MRLYCGMDLHSTNTVIVIINEQDERIVERRVGNDLPSILKQLEAYRDQLIAIVVESTYNWYWLVDGLIDHGYDVKLVNTTAVQQYDGLKQVGDRHDAFWLAHLLRLGILPTGYIYPRPQRWQRDLLRKRLGLVHERVRHTLALQSLWVRHTGERLNAQRLRQHLMELSLGQRELDLSIDSSRRAIATLDAVIDRLEADLYRQLKPTPADRLLKTVTGIGDVLAATINLETGPIERFAQVGNYASYCRLVASERWSNGKKKAKAIASAGIGI